MITERKVYSLVENILIKEINKFLLRKKIAINEIDNNIDIYKNMKIFLNRRLRRQGVKINTILLHSYALTKQLINRTNALLKKSHKIKDDVTFEFIYNALNKVYKNNEYLEEANKFIYEENLKNNNYNTFTRTKKRAKVSLSENNPFTINSNLNIQRENFEENNLGERLDNEDYDVYISEYNSSYNIDEEFNGREQLEIKHKHTFEDYINKVKGDYEYEVPGEKTVEELYKDNYSDVKQKSKDFFEKPSQIEDVNMHKEYEDLDNKKIVCDNCGHILPKGEFVCPNCKSIIIK